MKKLSFLAVIILFLIGCESRTVEQNLIPKRLAPTNVEGGLRIDPEINDDVLSSAEEVAFLAASTMGLDEDDATVTWISSQDFYIGYERILQATATQAELDAFYDTVHVVPSQALCVVNFESDTAFAIINPDTRVGAQNQFIRGSYGRTFDPNLLKLTDLVANRTVTVDIIDDIMSAYTGPYSTFIKDDLTRLTKCDDIIIPPTIPNVIMHCAPIQEQSDTISFYEDGDLAGVFDDCDSIESNIARAFGKIIGQFPIITSPIIGGVLSCSLNEPTNFDDNYYTPEEFMRAEYCQVIPYIESYVRGGSYIMTRAEAADFLEEHGIIVTTYQGDNNAVVLQAMQDDKIPLLYKENRWSIVYRCQKVLWHCPYGEPYRPKYMFSIDQCHPDAIADFTDQIEDDYTIVIIEYSHEQYNAI